MEWKILMWFLWYKYKGKYLEWSNTEACLQLLNLPIVPILYIGKFWTNIFALSQGNSILARGMNNIDQIIEGCVIKSFIEQNHPRIGRKILKSINPEYLVKKIEQNIIKRRKNEEKTLKLKLSVKMISCFLLNSFRCYRTPWKQGRRRMTVIFGNIRARNSTLHGQKNISSQNTLASVITSLRIILNTDLTG